MTRPRIGSGLSSLLQVSVSVNSSLGRGAEAGPQREPEQSQRQEREQAEQDRARQKCGQDQRSLTEARRKPRQNRGDEQDAHGMHRRIEADGHLAEATCGQVQGDQGCRRP